MDHEKSQLDQRWESLSYAEDLKISSCCLPNLVLVYKGRSRDVLQLTPTDGFCWKTGTGKQIFYIWVLAEKRSQHRCSIIHPKVIEKVFDYVGKRAVYGRPWRTATTCSVILRKICDSMICSSVRECHSSRSFHSFKNFRGYFSVNFAQHSPKRFHRTSFSFRPLYCT